MFSSLSAGGRLTRGPYLTGSSCPIRVQPRLHLIATGRTFLKTGSVGKDGILSVAPLFRLFVKRAQFNLDGLESLENKGNPSRRKL
jgi:hypothetical protein